MGDLLGESDRDALAACACGGVRDSEPDARPEEGRGVVDDNDSGRAAEANGGGGGVCADRGAEGGADGTGDWGFLRGTCACGVDAADVFGAFLCC